MNDIILESLKIKSTEGCVNFIFNNSAQYSLPFWYLRKYSPSAENRGHSHQPKPPPMVAENIKIIAAEPVGHYAIKFRFDDGHHTGIYTWEYLYQLALDYQQL